MTVNVSSSPLDDDEASPFPIPSPFPFLHNIVTPYRPDPFHYRCRVAASRHCCERLAESFRTSGIHLSENLRLHYDQRNDAADAEREHPAPRPDRHPLLHATFLQHHH